MEIEQKILKWSDEKGIFMHSTQAAQCLKAMSELGELADAIVKNNSHDAKDAIGDVAVCLINVAFFYGVSLEQCLNIAWEQIKDRRGRMVAGGVFVKDELR